MITTASILLVGFLFAAAPAAASDRRASDSEVEALLSAVVTVDGDVAAKDWTAMLARRSPTFREMLEVLQQSPHMRVTLISRADLKRRTRLLGRGTFTAFGGKIYGLLEFDRGQLDPVPQLRMIVHEIAHAVEIACLPPPEQSDDLRRQLRERDGASNRQLDMIETPFPDAVVRIVLGEHDRQASVGKLRGVAAEFGLTLPIAEAAADTSK